MSKRSMLLLSFASMISVSAGDFEKELSKYQEMKKVSLEKHSQENPELVKLKNKTKELSQKMMKLAMEISPDIANAEMAQRWPILVEKMNQLSEKNSEFKALYEERKSAYEEIANTLHLLDPKLKEQGKRTWEAKKTTQDI